jgi:hypothetical protein
MLTTTEHEVTNDTVDIMELNTLIFQKAVLAKIAQVTDTSVVVISNPMMLFVPQIINITAKQMELIFIIDFFRMKIKVTLELIFITMSFSQVTEMLPTATVLQLSKFNMNDLNTPTNLPQLTK